MRRLLALTLVLACAGALAVAGTGAGDGGSGDYQVRAIFQNAFSLVKGEDVKIAGVRVGNIESLDVTPDQKAAVVLNIERPGFTDFRKDAECTIRPQSLIGEKFVECTPTQPRPAGAPIPPELPVIRDGQPGAGQHLLPVEQTSRPVDIDLVNNVLRLPYRQRLGIIINEFGTGLAGRGEDLRSVIRNADPALKATDKVLKLLASQDKVLADLAKQSDVALAPVARERAAVQGFVEHAANVATATAERQPAFRAQFEKLPEFLRQLRPTMARLGGFADQATPVLTNLHAVAPDVGRLIKAMGPFSASATVSLKSLGEATVPGRKALVAAQGIVGDLRTFAVNLRPLATNLAALTTSFKSTGGVERLLDYLFYQVSAINGFDQFGHYLRASLILNLCTAYATSTSKSPVCSANFQKPIARAAGSTLTAEQALHMPGQSLQTRRTAAVLRGMSPAEAIRQTSGETDPTAPAGGVPAPTPSAPAASAPKVSSADQKAVADLTSGEDGAGAQDAGARTGQQLLDYLLGGGG
jgi:virulence factor Mce-like protein